MLFGDFLFTAALAKLVFQMMQGIDKVPHMGCAGNVLSFTSGEIGCLGHR
jgi:hypothetical protein